MTKYIYIGLITLLINGTHINATDLALDRAPGGAAATALTAPPTPSRSQDGAGGAGAIRVREPALLLNGNSLTIMGRSWIIPAGLEHLRPLNLTGAGDSARQSLFICGPSASVFFTTALNFLVERQGVELSLPRSRDDSEVLAGRCLESMANASALATHASGAVTNFATVASFLRDEVIVGIRERGDLSQLFTIYLTHKPLFDAFFEAMRKAQSAQAASQSAPAAATAVAAEQATKLREAATQALRDIINNRCLIPVLKEEYHLPGTTTIEEQFRAITEEQLRAITEEQLRAITEEQLRAITEQLRAITEQLRAIQNAQKKLVIAIIDWYTLDQLLLQIANAGGSAGEPVSPLYQIVQPLFHLMIGGGYVVEDNSEHVIKVLLEDVHTFTNSPVVSSGNGILVKWNVRQVRFPKLSGIQGTQGAHATQESVVLGAEASMASYPMAFVLNDRGRVATGADVRRGARSSTSVTVASGAGAGSAAARRGSRAATNEKKTSCSVM